MAWPTCQYCGEPLLGSRRNQKYCTADNRCKQAAYSQRKRETVAKQAIVLPTRTESVLADYIFNNAKQAREILDTLQSLLSEANFRLVRRPLTRIINSAADSEVTRVLALDQAQAKQDYKAYLERTDFVP